MSNGSVSPTVSYFTKMSINVKKVASCTDFDYNFDDDIGLSVFFAICFFIGLLLIFAGYRLFRFSLFIQVLSVISVPLFIIFITFTTLSTLYSGLAAAGCGVMLGIMAIFIETLGLVCASLHQSIFLTVCVLYIAHVFTTLTNIFVAPGLILITFIVLTPLVIKWEKLFSIVYFSSFGAILVMLTIDYYLNLSLLRKAAYENLVSVPRVTKPCWFSWIIFGVWPLMVGMGCLVQLLKTGRNYDRREEKCCCKKETEPPLHLLSNKNDVIARAWIEAPSTPLEKRDSYSPIHCGEEVYLMEDTTAV